MGKTDFWASLWALLSSRGRRRYLATHMPEVAARRPSALLRSCAGMGITSLVAHYGERYEIELDTRAGHIAVGVLKTGAFQPEPMAVVARLLGEARPLFVNVGANVGTTLLNAHAQGFSRFVAVEPVARNFALLRGNMARNGIAARLHHAALGRVEEEREINLDAHNGGGHSFHGLADPGGVERVRVTRLDRLGLDEPFFLWVDTEGFEAEVLAGCDPALLARLCLGICIELSPLHSGPGPALEVLDQLAALFPVLRDDAGRLVRLETLRDDIAAGRVEQIDLVAERLAAVGAEGTDL